MHTITVWLSSLLAGAGIEIFAMRTLVRFSSHKLLLAIAFLTRLATPLFLGLAFYAESTWALPFLVLPLFKLGLPMINAQLHTALRSWQLFRRYAFSKREDTHEKVQGSAHLLRKTVYHACMCLGHILHNMCVGFLACCVMTKFEHLDASMLAVLSPILIQTWFALGEDRFPEAHLVAHLILEVWWQTEALSHVLYADKRLHFKIAVWGLLAGHWLLLLADVPARLKGLLRFFRWSSHDKAPTVFSAASLFVLQPALPSLLSQTSVSDAGDDGCEVNGPAGARNGGTEESPQAQMSNAHQHPKRLISYHDSLQDEHHRAHHAASVRAVHLIKQSVSEV